MIRTLRRKFILINMALVTLVLLIVFAAMMVSALRQAQGKVDATLTETLARSSQGGPTVPELGKRRGEGARRDLLPSFLVELDASGALLQSSFFNVSVSDAVLTDAIAQVLSADDGAGNVRGYALAYLARYSSAGTRIAFAVTDGVQTDVRTQALTSLIVGVCGLVAFFGISVFLSSVALRPAERAWQQQRQFVADASHELKTPLTVILANTDILLKHPDEPVSAQLRWVENTRAEGMRMKGLIDDLLYLARMDVTAAPVQATFSLSDAVWSAALPFEAVAFERNVHLELQIADGVSLTGNEAQIRQLVAILLDNAVKYADANGTATLSLSPEPDGARLAAHNTGAPIDKADLPHVCERFYRAEASRDRRTGGFGLGLAIAQSIAEQNGALITVTSDAVSGTTFTVEWRARRHGKRA